MNDGEDPVRDLEEYCSASNSNLSRGVLREKLGRVSAMQTGTSHFLHELCSNENVTLEMVEVVLEFIPSAPCLCSSRYHRVDYDDDMDVDAYEADADSYPIHLACGNERCPNSVVDLLARSNPSALGHLCILGDHDISPHVYHDHDANCHEGVPLHYYFARAANIDLSTVKALIEMHPNSLMSSGDEVEWFPIHVLVANPKVGELGDILQYLIDLNLSCLKCIGVEDRVALHEACYSPHVTPDIVQLLVDGWPESTRQEDCRKSLPIHKLCENEGLDDAVKLDVLKILIGAYPDSLKAWTRVHQLPIHFASVYQSSSFVKVLADAYPESLSAGDEDRNPPFHLACAHSTVDVVQYLYDKDPESIFVKTDYGFYPIHCAIRNNQTEVAKLLLRLAPDSASTPVRPPGNFIGSNFTGCSPLHIACAHDRWAEMSTVHLLFDAHPAAIYTKASGGTSHYGKDPLDYAKSRGHTEAVRFLRKQLDDVSALSSVANTPIHHDQWSNITFGSMKLILEKNPGVRFDDDPNQNSPLHCACHEGRLHAVNHMLRVTTASVSTRNSDGKLPFELLIEADCERGGLDYTEAIWHLLVAHPETMYTCPLTTG